MNVSPLTSASLEMSPAGERIGQTNAAQSVDASLEELIRSHPEAAAAARQFEAVFLRQLLGSVDKMSSVGSGSKTQGEVVGSMMKGVLSDQMSAAGGIGLAEVILRALTEGLSPERSSAVSTPAVTTSKLLTAPADLPATADEPTTDNQLISK